MAMDGRVADSLASRNFFIAASDGKPYGPIDKEELDGLVAAGMLPPACQLLCQEGDRWRSVAEVYPRAGHPVIFIARSCHTIASDRIYRVDIRDKTAYFLRIGGQFNIDRGAPIGAGYAAAFAILGMGELLFRKHRKEEIASRDANSHPKDLLNLHPHNFRLTAAEIQEAVFLPPRWYSNLRGDFGRLAIHVNHFTKWRFEFETFGDMLVAFLNLGSYLAQKRHGSLVERSTEYVHELCAEIAHCAARGPAGFIATISWGLCDVPRIWQCFLLCLKSRKLRYMFPADAAPPHRNTTTRIVLCSPWPPPFVQPLSSLPPRSPCHKFRN